MEDDVVDVCDCDTVHLCLDVVVAGESVSGVVAVDALQSDIAERFVTVRSGGERLGLRVGDFAGDRGD
ncbi:hypothetical protein [Nocardia abscessus]|uniref:hypothetical protein n=1 Tax=Nocardia abscessus TaxID=120957 RepID=UPI002457FA31|nr:hypothetical protein [Nocardia abscessus]